MNEYKHLTEMIPEMEPDEIFYKRIFLEASSHAAAGFTYHPGNALDETILPSDEDTIIFRHNRYAPAFLHSHTFFEMIYVLRGTCENIFTSHTISMH